MGSGVTCSQVREMAGAYVLNALTRHDRQRVDHHLDRCARCRKEVGELADAAALLSFSLSPAEPPAAVRARLFGCLAGPAPAAPSAHPQAARPGRISRRELFRPGVLRVAVVAAALFALGLAGGAWLHGRSFEAGTRAQLALARAESELWRGLARRPSAMVRLEPAPSLRHAVALAAVEGLGDACSIRLVGAGLPAPHAGARYRVQLELTDDSSWEVGELTPTQTGLWALTARVPVPPHRIRVVRVDLEERAPSARGKPAVLLRGSLQRAGPQASGEPGRP